MNFKEDKPSKIKKKKNIVKRYKSSRLTKQRKRIEK